MAGIIKVNQYQDFNGNTILTSDGSGNLTTMKTNYPAFEAYVNTAQNLTDSTTTKIQYDGEVFDTNSCYDNSTNYRFTPTVAGKYFVYVNFKADVNAGNELNDMRGMLYKNGSEYKDARVILLSNPQKRHFCSIHTVVDMNGSSDYLEVFGFHDSVSNFVLSVLTGTTQCTFGAYRIGS